MFHMQSPKDAFVEDKICLKAPKASIYIEKLAARVSFSKKYGLEISTSTPGVLLDGLALHRKPSTSCILSKNEVGYLIFSHDGALYSFDLKHKDHIATITLYLAEHNKALYERISDTFERTTQVLRIGKAKPSLQEAGTRNKQVDFENILLSYYRQEYKRKTLDLATLKHFVRFHAENILSIGTNEGNDIVVDKAAALDFQIYLQVGPAGYHIVADQHMPDIQLTSCENKIYPSIPKGSIHIQSGCSLSQQGTRVFELVNGKITIDSPAIVYDVDTLMKARGHFLSSC